MDCYFQCLPTKTNKIQNISGLRHPNFIMTFSIGTLLGRNKHIVVYIQ
jgi:hypothetical protein